MFWCVKWLKVVTSILTTRKCPTAWKSMTFSWTNRRAEVSGQVTNMESLEVGSSIEIQPRPASLGETSQSHELEVTRKYQFDELQEAEWGLTWGWATSGGHSLGGEECTSLGFTSRTSTRLFWKSFWKDILLFLAKEGGSDQETHPVTP